MNLQELLARQWVKRDGTPDQKMVDFCLKSYRYVLLSDAWVDCCGAKPPIDSTMWYDDETKGPDESFENFRTYNLRSHQIPMLSETTEFGGVREIWLTIHYYDDRSNGRLLGVTTKHPDELPRAHELRRATPEEIVAINRVRAEVNADYEKRLSTYWKRYGHKVRAEGYWANR